MWFVRDLNLFTLGFFLGGGGSEGPGGGREVGGYGTTVSILSCNERLKILILPPFPRIKTRNVFPIVDLREGVFLIFYFNWK